MTENTAWAVGSTECEPIIIWADGTPIAKVYNSEANAHLIAAAPDLYSEGRRLLDTVNAIISGGWDVQDYQDDLAADALRFTDAIAKAEGREE